MGYQRAQFERRKKNVRVRKGKNSKGTRVHENKRCKYLYDEYPSYEEFALPLGDEEFEHPDD